MKKRSGKRTATTVSNTVGKRRRSVVCVLCFAGSIKASEEKKEAIINVPVLFVVQILLYNFAAMANKNIHAQF